MSRVPAGAAMLVAALVGCTANDDIHTPVVATVTPGHATPTSVVSIDGDYFCAQPEPEDGEEVDPLDCEHTGSVTFDEMPGIVGEYTDTRIMVEVPRLEPSVVRVRVAVMGRTSNGVELTIDAL